MGSLLPEHKAVEQVVHYEYQVVVERGDPAHEPEHKAQGHNELEDDDGREAHTRLRAVVQG